MLLNRPRFITLLAYVLFFVIFFITFFHAFFEARYFYKQNITLLNSELNESSKRTKQIIDMQLKSMELFTNELVSNEIFKSNILMNKEKIEEYFVNHKNDNLGIFQERILDKNGFEIIRVEHSTKPKIVASQNLQDKSKRDYYQIAISSEYNKVLFSQLDLNIENGKIDIPYRPTIRTMIRFENFGNEYILVLNFDLSKILQVATKSKIYDIFLVEPNDLQINYHENVDYFFSKQLDRKLKISDIYESDLIIKYQNLYKIPYQFCQTIKPVLAKQYYEQMIESIVIWSVISILLAFILTLIFSLVLKKFLSSLQNRIKEIINFQHLEVQNEQTYFELDLIYKDIKKLAKDQKIFLNEVSNNNNFIQSLLDSSEEKIIILDNAFNIVWANFQAFDFFRKHRINIKNILDNKEPEDKQIELQVGDKFMKMYSKKLDKDKIIVHFYDITDEVNQKNESSAILNAQESIIIITNGKTLLNSNKAFFDIFGFDDMADFMSKHKCICDLFLQKNGYTYFENDEQKYEWFEKLKNNENTSRKVCMLNRFGEERIYKILNPGVVRNDKLVVVFVDITELTKNNEIINKATRFNAMGEMIAMIAHQWRQPLAKMGIIMTTLDVRMQMNELTSDDWKNAKNKHSELLKIMSNSIQNFVNFFKETKIEQKVNLIDIIEEQFNLLRPSFDELSVNFEILNSLENINDVFVTISRSKFEQAISNILRNSFEQFVINQVSMPEIKISVSNEKEFLILQVFDNGGGVDISKIEFLFDPYFSTKSKNETGLGLYFSKVIIESHFGGVISADNHLDGFLITIKLPIFDKK